MSSEAYKNQNIPCKKQPPFSCSLATASAKRKKPWSFTSHSFPNSEIKKIDYFKEGEPQGKAGTVKHAIFTIANQEYMAIHSMGHNFNFTPATSVFVTCENEEESKQPLF